MSWHHRHYHLSFCIQFRLPSISFLPKRLMEFRNKRPLCVTCQFGVAHCRPGQTKGKKSGSISRLDQTNIGDGGLVYHIASAQPVLIPQMSGFLTSQHFWGCITFMDHVSKYVYVHLMRDLSLSETLLTKETLEKLMEK